MRASHLPICLAAAAVAALAPAAAVAKGGDVRASGSCSKSSSVKLKLSGEDRGIESELEVDQNRNGVRWTVTLRRNGARVTTTHATTRGPSGSFELRRVLTNGSGADTISARAVSPSGEVCTVRARFG